jgi:hypothetical protein
MDRPSFYASSCINGCGVVHGGGNMRRLVIFIVDKDRHEVLQEGSCMLFTNEPESITLPNGTTQELGPTTHVGFAIFEDLCLLVKESTRNSFNSRPLSFALELIESVLTNYHQLFHKVCLSFPVPFTYLRPVCQQLPSNDSHALNIPGSYSYYSATISPCSSKRSPSALLSRPSSAACRHPCRLPFAQAILLQARDGGRCHPHDTHQTRRLVPVRLGLGG